MDRHACRWRGASFAGGPGLTPLLTLLLTRRAALAGALATGAVAPRVFAQAFAVSEQHRRVLGVAKDQLERVRPQVWRTDVVGIADFALPSSLPRLHFADLEAGMVHSFLVTHGKGSDSEHDGFLKRFSNEVGSEATSRGAYITYEWYDGKYGASIRLGGLDPDNCNAAQRAVVMHPAWYAAPDMLQKWGKLGRSDGCFAMAPDDFPQALWHLAAGRLLYADKLGLS
ncbi:murein L,D-transpeptidase catalytic domain-containing protein [Novosphingobium sp.]|uniref:murein L,D-transpeptidase catalytic domain-containing protein n=1 Tax=Novosphingobium sp. TaxID=1874826 RepID=UPI003D098111